MPLTSRHDLSVLWSRWADQHALAEREALVDAYTPFVRILAAKCYANRVGPGLEFGDYLQFGMVGLLESIDRFDPQAGVKFETFAGYRIQGAILNGIEDLTEVHKQLAVRRRMVRERSASLAAAGADGAQGKTALERLAHIAIGLALGFSLDDAGLYSAQSEAAMPDNAYSRVELGQFKRRLAELVDLLPAQERTVVYRHYFQQVPFDEIAMALKLTKGRISQIHRTALARLAELQRQHVQFNVLV